MKSKINSILALGADIKSRYCVYRNNKITLSKDFGNLEDLDNFKQFKKSVLKTSSSFDVVAFDSHPGYFSSGLADQFKAKKRISVQHHHAHIASILSTGKISDPVIGVAFDGTGYGTDDNMWGGEFMVADRLNFKRIAHFKYLRMPGAELAVKEPWRMAFSLVYDYLGEEIFNQDLGFLKLYPKKYYSVLIKMLKHNINSPLTSSVGRLFDVVSSILGVCHKISYEAQAAIKLEQLASRSHDSSYYDLDILEEEGLWVISHNKLIRGILSDLNSDLPKEDIARKFHNSLMLLSVKVVNRIRHVHNINDVVLTGGVFANKLLFNLLTQKLSDSGYNLITQKDIPINDLGICLGQAYIASNSK